MAVWSVASTGHPFLLSKLAYQAIGCPRKRGRLTYITLITIALVLAASSVVFGATTRIVVLDLNTVINESQAGKAANAALAALVATKQAEVDAMWADIEGFSQELDA